jgi:hypothetical protein
MSKVKFVSPSGKVVWLGEKVLQGTSIRQMGYRLYDEVFAPVAPTAVWNELKKTVANKVTDTDNTFQEVAEEVQEKPKRGRPRAKNTVSDADQA